MNKNCLGKLHYYLLIILFSFSSILAMGQGYDTTKWKFSNPKQFGFTAQTQNSMITITMVSRLGT